MNILYLADPHSLHDQKWISYFSASKLNQTYIVPRNRHVSTGGNNYIGSGATLLSSIPDFSIVRVYQTLFTVFKIRSIIKKNDIDLIHILYAEPNALWSVFRKTFGVPVIISTRGTDVLKTIPETFLRKSLINFLVAPLYKRAFLNASWVTCTSEKQIQSIVSFSGRKERISIVRTGVDLSKPFEKGDLPSALIGGTKYILFPRYIRPVYNHEFCLEAIKLLPPLIKSEYKMVFLGRNAGDLEYQAVLEKMMESVRNTNFVFLEKQSQRNLFELYRGASLVVMTPLSDGSPVSGMEALLCGAKLILGPLEYDKEIFSSTAKILKQWSVVELKDSIVSVLESIEEIEIGAETKKLMDRGHNMKNLEILYKKILS
jgi:hypothetical protein